MGKDYGRYTSTVEKILSPVGRRGRELSTSRGVRAESSLGNSLSARDSGMDSWQKVTFCWCRMFTEMKLNEVWWPLERNMFVLALEQSKQRWLDLCTREEKRGTKPPQNKQIGKCALDEEREQKKWLGRWFGAAETKHEEVLKYWYRQLSNIN